MKKATWVLSLCGLPLYLLPLSACSEEAPSAGPIQETYSSFFDGVFRAELAGRRLESGPGFGSVRSFHDEEHVLAAASGVSMPAISGKTCDVVVVESRSRDEWMDDPELIEVRERMQSESFGEAETIFSVAEPGELEASHDGRPGVGYDLVLDCDRDGRLNDGDVIDTGSSSAGFYVVPDVTAAGPRPVRVAEHDGGHLLQQLLYFPADLNDDEEVPLVVIAHGWGHQKEYYDHLGEHFASYGYIAASIANDVQGGGPDGTESASTSLLNNTDYLLDHMQGRSGAIADGALDGHIDSQRIVWTGHSTGGECIVRAYTRIHDGDVEPEHFQLSDIKLLSAIAPVAWLSKSSTHPHNVPFHLITGGADVDTGNYPDNDYSQNLAIFERARGHRHLNYVHGAGHGDFHNGPQNEADQPDRDAPDLIGVEGAHPVIKGYQLALIELYLQGSVGMLDFFERAPEDFRPRGIPSDVVVSNEYRPSLSSAIKVLDDFQSEPALDKSSSGTSVSLDLAHAEELLMSDTDGSFEFTPEQPANGMTRSLDPDDDARCLAFDWNEGESRSLELDVADERWSDYRLLSFRAAQGTRHPHTEALGGPLSFTVVLKDAAGTTSSIDFGAYAEIHRPYERPGLGSGSGWANEFSTVHIPLADFVRASPRLDLGAIVSVRMRFGQSFGAAQGRLFLDDILLME